MNSSLLQFARDFARLQSRLAEATGDQPLLLLLDFWPQLQRQSEDISYGSYFDEFKTLLLAECTSKNLIDLHLDELQMLLDLLGAIDSDSTRNCRIAVKRQLAHLYLCVGEYRSALEVLAGDEERSFIESILPEEHGLTPQQTLEQIVESAAARDLPLTADLRESHARWEDESSGPWHDRVKCLFVDTGAAPNGSRGRLRELRGEVELAGKLEGDDHVSFDNQVRAKDDPFVGVAYRALNATKTALSGSQESTNSKPVHAYFAVSNSGESFTGDSIGLACALISYTQLLIPRIDRHERFISGEIAVSGGIDEQGKLVGVNKESLPAKIKRAFFSPLRAIVLPYINRKAAVAVLQRLQQQYPQRRLHLITWESLQEVTDDRNIIHTERMCFSEFAAKRAYKYTRSLKVQIPLLIVLLGIFGGILAQLFPKQMPWFDDNPRHIVLTGTGFTAINVDSVSLWSRDFSCEGLNTPTESSSGKVYDLDDDGRNEVLFIPKAKETVACDDNANLYVYDHDGELLFRRRCAILGEYSNDTAYSHPYSPYPIEVFRDGGQNIIMTQVYDSRPARAHIRFWTNTGDSLGWYINAGHNGGHSERFAQIESSYVLLLSLNNAIDLPCLIALDARKSHGVCPPKCHYDADSVIFDCTGQLQYIVFPKSPLNIAGIETYNQPSEIIVESRGVIRVDIDESDGKGRDMLSYFLDSNLRVFKVEACDVYKTSRKKMIGAGKIPDISLSEDIANLRDAVRYWTDSDWVTEGERRARDSISLKESTTRRAADYSHYRNWSETKRRRRATISSDRP